MKGVLASKLTWYSFVKGETPLGVGTVVRDKRGGLWLCGDASASDYDGGYVQGIGCGCCTDEIQIDDVAYLSELLENQEGEPGA